MTRDEFERIKREYMEDMRPWQDCMAGVLALAIPAVVLTSDGKLTHKYDSVTQQKLFTLKLVMQEINDRYKTRYPDMFKFL